MRRCNAQSTTGCDARAVWDLVNYAAAAERFPRAKSIARDLSACRYGRSGDARAGHHDDGGQGFVETDTENEQVVIPPVLTGPRCLPGASGDRGWRQGAPGGRAQSLPPPRPGAGVSGTSARTLVSYVAKREQPVWRRLQRAYNRGTTRPCRPQALEDRNHRRPAVAEGLDETLTLHRLGVYGVLGRSSSPCAH